MTEVAGPSPHAVPTFAPLNRMDELIPTRGSFNFGPGLVVFAFLLRGLETAFLPQDAVRLPHAMFKWQTYFIAVVLFVPSLIDFIAVRKTYQRLSRQEWAVIAALSAALPLAPIFMTRAIWYFYLDVVAVAEQLPPLLILGGGMRLLRERHSLRFVPIVLFSVLGSFLLFSNRYAAQHEGRSFFSFFAFVLLAVVSATAAVLFPRHLLQHSRSRVSPMELASAQTAGSFLVLTVYAFLVAPALPSPFPGLVESSGSNTSFTAGSFLAALLCRVGGGIALHLGMKYTRASLAGILQRIAPVIDVGITPAIVSQASLRALVIVGIVVTLLSIVAAMVYANADEETRRRDYGNAFEPRLGTSADESGGGAADSAGNAGAEAVNPMMGYATSKADRDALRLHVRAVVPPMGSTEQPISQEFPDLEVNMDGSVEDLVRALAARLGSPKDGAMPYCEAGAVAWTAPHPVDARVLCDGQPLSLETRLRDVPALARAPTDTSSLLVVAFQSPAAHVV